MAVTPRHKAPLTLALIVRVNEILSLRGMTRGDLRLVLNQFLPFDRQVPDTHSGMVKLHRWLNPSSNNWHSPSSEIALALQKAAQKIEEKS